MTSLRDPILTAERPLGAQRIQIFTDIEIPEREAAESEPDVSNIPERDRIDDLLPNGAHGLGADPDRNKRNVLVRI